MSGCSNDTWAPTFVVAKAIGDHSVWTGSEMILYGAMAGRYNPATDTWAGISTGPNAPTSRIRYSIVWTGTEMIVWGGYGAGLYLADGSRYSPLSDSWTKVPTGANSPSARADHSAVWTGKEMIIWGGYFAFPSQYLNTGGRFDPSTGSWTATSTGVNVPTARSLHTSVWTGTEMVAWGGFVGGVGTTNTGGRYNPSTDSWITTSVGPSVPSARQYHTAVWTGTEMIVWGGYGIGYLNSGGRYRPATDSWTATSVGANVPAGRQYHTAVWTGTTMIVWGGMRTVTGGTTVFYKDGGRYDPPSDTWLPTSTGPNVPDERQYHTAVWTGSEMIVWGGSNQSGDLNTGGRYSVVTDSWIPTSVTGNVPSIRERHTSLWTGSEMIVWGGSTPNGDVNTGGRYYPVTDSWTPVSLGANVPSPRSGHTLVWTGTTAIVWGGGNNSTGGVYSPESDSWTPTSTGSNSPFARSDHTAVWTGTEMIIWGGMSTLIPYMNDGGRYDPSTDSWRLTSTGANVPTGRIWHEAAWTGTEMIVWGGFSYDGQYNYLNTGGRYDPATDSWNPTSTGAGVPTGRYSHSTVWTGSEFIIWGGLDVGGVYLDTGGRYEPSGDSWVATSTADSVPTPRRFHTAVWTGQEMIVWGGFTFTGDYANTGGRYSPSLDSWMPTSIASGVPAARFDHSAVWTGQSMIVWGGAGLYGDTNTGGRYCACSSGLLFYRDRDGDGYGDPSMSAPSCSGSIPAGYADNGLDCNDSDSSIHPNAAEINDGIDNQCPGDDGFGTIDEISGVSGFLTTGDKTLFSWTAQSGASSYEVARSMARDFPNDCTLFSTTQPFVVDSDVPPSERVLYYLVRPSAPHTGSWGQYSDGTPRIVNCP